MTGKELKEFAAKCGDDAVIEVQPDGYGTWRGRFTVRAIVQVVSNEEKEQDA
jgi:hypothetical protein